MKRLLLVLALLCAACEQQRYGVPCVGVMDQKRPDVAYVYSTRNLLVGLVFSESIIVPAVVVAKGLECPVGAPVLGGVR